MEEDLEARKKQQEKERNRKRSLQDRWISWKNATCFAITEPVRVKLARARFDTFYKEVEENPLVSVCVPTYNRAELLIERAVTSILGQTYQNLELIIVGDHCTDDTEEKLAQIDDPRLRFVNLPERKRNYPQNVENHWFVGGAIPANKAISMATGKWIARNDDDDVWTPDHIEKLLRFAQKEQLEFVSAAYIAERHGKQVVVDLKDEIPRIGGVQTWLYRSYLSFFRYNPECWRKSWNRVWDADMQDRLYRSGVRMGFLEDVVAYVLPRPGETTVGLDAYRLSAEKMMEHYRFDNE